MNNVNKLLVGRVLTNIGDSFIYMLFLWFLNTRMQSPVFLSIMFILVNSIDVFSFLIGPIIDRVKLKRVLVYSSLIQTFFVLALLLAILVWPHMSTITLAIAGITATFIVELGSAFIYPLESKVVKRIVPENELVKVNSLFQATYKTIDVLLNAVATIAVTFVAMNAYLAITIVILWLATMFYRFISIPESTTAADQEELEEESLSSYGADIKEGVSELFAHKKLLRMLLPLTGINLFYAASAVALPKFAQTFLGGQAFNYGSVLLVASVGSILGAFLTRFVQNYAAHEQRLTAICLLVSGAGQLMFACGWLVNGYVSLLGLMISGAAISMMNVFFASWVQAVIPDQTLGRVSTINESILSAMMPIGDFAGGLMLAALGPVAVQVMYGVSLLIFTAFYVFIR